jgi:hypothetical protein
MLRLVVGKRPHAEQQRLLLDKDRLEKLVPTHLTGHVQRALHFFLFLSRRSIRTRGWSFSIESASPDPSWRIPFVPV